MCTAKMHVACGHEASCIAVWRGTASGVSQSRSTVDQYSNLTSVAQRHARWEHHLTLLPCYNLPLNATVRCAVRAPLHVMCLQASPKDSASVRAPTSRSML